jgi:hypothetical protein
MDTSSFRRTAVAAIAGTFTAAIPQAHANVVNLSWYGAYAALNPAGDATQISPTDYVSGYYSNGDSSTGTFGAPYFPANVGPDADCTSFAPACVTAHGWYGNRTPVSGTLSFDTSTGAGVGTINSWMFFGDVPGSGPGTTVASYPQGITFQTIDTLGTIVGSLLFSWNGLGHSVSIVLDGSGLFSSLSTLIAGGPTTSLSGVGALSATEGTDYNPKAAVTTYPLGPVPIATTTLNTGAGCDALTLATQVNAYTIVTNFANVSTCTTGMTDDGIGGDPMTSTAISGYNQIYDITSIHFESFVQTPVPVPAAVWLFGSGLLGLIGLARRKRKADI